MFKSEKESFNKDMYRFMAIPDYEGNLDDFIFEKYPRDSSVMKQIFSFTYILFSNEFWMSLPITYDKNFKK